MFPGISATYPPLVLISSDIYIRLIITIRPDSSLVPRPPRKRLDSCGSLAVLGVLGVHKGSISKHNAYISNILCVCACSDSNTSIKMFNGGALLSIYVPDVFVITGFA